MPGLGLDRDAAAVPFDDLLADGQSDAGAGKLFPLVQPLEHAKNLFKVLRIDSQPVVFHRKIHLLSPLLAAETCTWGTPPGSGT